MEVLCGMAMYLYSATAGCEQTVIISLRQTYDLFSIVVADVGPET